MKAIALSAAFIVMGAQLTTPQTPQKFGKWLDTTKDTRSGEHFFVMGSSGKLLITEDYEVTETHEICASVTGYFLEKSELGRYQLYFKGMRTSAGFEFTTQYDAEKFAEKYCTPDSLRSIKRGKGTMGRSY